MNQQRKNSKPVWVSILIIITSMIVYGYIKSHNNRNEETMRNNSIKQSMELPEKIKRSMDKFEKRLKNMDTSKVKWGHKNQ